MRFSQLEQGQPEIFYTIQGEGRSIGEPATFARLSGCNLQCGWCDTPDTWAFTPALAEQHEDGVQYDRETQQIQLQVGEAVDRITGFPCKRVVITGGEPMLQQGDIVELITGLREEDPDFWVEIETNGTIPPKPELVEQVNQFNVSPKLENSGNELKRRLRDTAMEAYAATEKSDFKFVVAEPTDVTEVQDIVDRYAIAPNHVFLMPEGRDEETIRARQLELVELCKANGYNLTTRLHIMIWGSKRGV